MLLVLVGQRCEALRGHDDLSVGETDLDDGRIGYCFADLLCSFIDCCRADAFAGDQVGAAVAVLARGRMLLVLELVVLLLIASTGIVVCQSRPSCHLVLPVPCIPTSASTVCC